MKFRIIKENGTNKPAYMVQKKLLLFWRTLGASEDAFSMWQPIRWNSVKDAEKYIEEHKKAYKKTTISIVKHL